MKDYKLGNWAKKGHFSPPSDPKLYFSEIMAQKLYKTNEKHIYI